VTSSPTHLEAAIAGRTGAAGVIAGPPGSGTAAAIEGLERRARAKGWLTCRASGSTADAPPYAIVRALLDPAPFGLDGRRPVAENADAVVRHCAAIAAHAPIALFVEHAQWADLASLELLARLAERTRELPLLVVLATVPRAGHDVGAIVRAETIRLTAPRPCDDATAAWNGLQTGSSTAATCAALARRALRRDPGSPVALRTLILTDRVREARDGLGRPHEPAVMPLAAELALRFGRRADAEREALRAATVGADASEVLVAALLARGALGEAREVSAAGAALLLAEGRPEAAASAAREDGRRSTSQGRTNPAVTDWRSTLAIALAQAGETDEAMAVADDEVVLARAFGAPTALARALHARCLAEPDPEQRTALAAAALATGTPDTLLLASARIELGIARLRLGETQDAIDAFTHAAAVATRAGALPLASRALMGITLTEGALSPT
jgi:hypothetical protein